jgi:acetyltransferase-like isoleucine patch superfamily enzyme
MFNFIKNKIRNLTRPRMIYGYKRNDGLYLKNTRISNTVYIGNKEKFYIEDNVFIGHYNFIDASNSIFIGEGCQITNFISIITHSSHISIRLYGKEYQKISDMIGYVKGKIIIGKYSFIGPHSTIMPGTEIGKGSIVAAYSYVEGEFPDFSIIAGNPAILVGNSKKLDKKYLEMNPEINKFYKEWSES